MKNLEIKKVGKCKLCGQEGTLTFEHIPPRAAGNKITEFYEINQEEYFQNAREFAFTGKKPKGPKKQGGVGGYFLCKECNNFLGARYAKDYISLSNQCELLLRNSEFSQSRFEVLIENVNFLKVLKQVISIFICSNEYWFSEEYPDLLEFVKNKDSDYLPSKYNIYMYLNDEGANRSGNMNIVMNVGIVCEFTFPPLGFVLVIDGQNSIEILYEITNFKYFKTLSSSTITKLYLNRLPTYYPFPLDYRTKEELI